MPCRYLISHAGLASSMTVDTMTTGLATASVTYGTISRTVRTSGSKLLLVVIQTDPDSVLCLCYSPYMRII